MVKWHQYNKTRRYYRLLAVRENWNSNYCPLILNCIFPDFLKLSGRCNEANIKTNTLTTDDVLISNKIIICWFYLNSYQDKARDSKDKTSSAVLQEHRGCPTQHWGNTPSDLSQLLLCCHRTSDLCVSGRSVTENKQFNK